MPKMVLVVDDKAVRRVFAQAPQRAVARMGQLIEGAAIDIQREMRMRVNVGATGETRRSINYRIGGRGLEAEIKPQLDQRRVAALEYGSRPHWTSVRPGTSLYRWATHKGINPFAVQRSIARKGTKAHPFIEPTYRLMAPRVNSDIVRGMAKFAQGLDSGAI